MDTLHKSVPESFHGIRRLIERANRHLLETDSTSPEKDSVVYVGNWQDAIPRALWIDPLLDAIDVRAWGLIRTQTRPDSPIIVSIHTLLQQELDYSKPTASKVLAVLRTTRWASLCSDVRDNKGRFRGHIYAVHDGPLSVHDTLHLDPNYLAFLKEKTLHKNKKLRKVARIMLADIFDESGQDEEESERQGAVSRFYAKSYEFGHPARNQVNHLSSRIHQVKKVNLAKSHRVKNINPDGSLKNQSVENQVKNVNPVPICSSCSSKNNNINKTTTTTSWNNSARARGGANNHAVQLYFPECLSASERELAMSYLEHVDESLWQDFLDELGGQILHKKNTARPVGNPIGYLSWLCDQSRQGQTRLTSCGVKYRENRERARRMEQQTQALQADMADHLANKIASSETRLGKRLEAIHEQRNATKR